jgi:hypothetical protein
MSGVYFSLLLLLELNKIYKNIQLHYICYSSQDIYNISILTKRSSEKYTTDMNKIVYKDHPYYSEWMIAV